MPIEFQTVKSIPTPCTKVCSIEGRSGLCRGCFRTRDEIARWGMMKDSERYAIMAELPARQYALPPNPFPKCAR